MKSENSEAVFAGILVSRDLKGKKVILKNARRLFGIAGQSPCVPFSASRGGGHERYAPLSPNYFCGTGMGRHHYDDDAHLMAAAPELLDACKMAMTSLANKSELPPYRKVYRKLMQAIAKAEGKV